MINILRNMLYHVRRFFLASFSFLRHIWSFCGSPTAVQYTLPVVDNLTTPLFQSKVYSTALDLASTLHELSFQNIRYLHFVRKLFGVVDSLSIHEHAAGAWHQMSTVLKGLRTVPEHYALLVLSTESLARAHAFGNRVYRMDTCFELRTQRIQLAGSLIATTGRLHQNIMQTVMESMSLQERVHFAIAAIGARAQLGEEGALFDLLAYLHILRPTPSELRAAEPDLNADSTITDAALQEELDKLTLEHIFDIATENPAERRTRFFLLRIEELFCEGFESLLEDLSPLPNLIQAACKFCAEKWGRGLFRGSIPLNDLITNVVTLCISNYDRVEAALKTIGTHVTLDQGLHMARNDPDQETFSSFARFVVELIKYDQLDRLAMLAQELDPLLAQTNRLTTLEIVSLLGIIGKDRRIDFNLDRLWVREHLFAHAMDLYRLSESEIIMRHTKGMSQQEVQTAFNQASVAWAKSIKLQPVVTNNELIEETIIELPSAMRPICFIYAQELAKTLGALCTRLLLPQATAALKSLPEAEAHLEPLPQTAEELLAMLCERFLELDLNYLLNLCPCYRQYLISILNPQQYVTAVSETSLVTTTPPQATHFIEVSRQQDEQAIRRAVSLLGLFVCEIQESLLAMSEEDQEIQHIRFQETQNLQPQETARLQAQERHRLQSLVQQALQVEFISNSTSPICRLLLVGIDHFLADRHLAQRTSSEEKPSKKDRLFLEHHAFMLIFRKAFCSDETPQPTNNATIQFLQQIGLLQSPVEGFRLPKAINSSLTQIASHVPRSESGLIRFEQLQNATSAMEQLAIQAGRQNTEMLLPSSPEELYDLMQQSYFLRHDSQTFPEFSDEINQMLQNQILFDRSEETLAIYDSEDLAIAFVMCHFDQLRLCFVKGNLSLRKEIKDLLLFVVRRIYRYEKSYSQSIELSTTGSAEVLLNTIEAHPVVTIYDAEDNLFPECVDPVLPRLRQLLMIHRTLLLEVLQEHFIEISAMYENGD